MTNVLEIELFKNLCDWDLERNNHRDLHSDFGCNGIEFAQQSLHLKFQGLAKSSHKLEIEFMNVEVVRMDISFDEPLANLTLDSLYRGRFEIDGGLVEFDERGRGYFYLEFYEGPELEFWSKSVSMDDTDAVL